AVDFCQAFESDRALTEEFTNRIAPLDVIRPQTAHFTPQGTTEQKVFAEYFGIDQARLGELSDEEFLSLRQGEAMGVLYSIITSMTNWRSLLQRRAMRFDLDESKITERVIN
ncbi:MAG: SapC family protein, partial [Hyphococcus sp.]